MAIGCFKLYTKIGQIHGKGSDTSGDYVIRGNILPGNQCQFVKTYASTGQQVIYSGLLKKTHYGHAEINGHWTMNAEGYHGMSYEFKIKKDYEELSASEGEGSGSD